jgi:beta-phosphoglucomutase-like phosphatase (HAD superfamily)
VTGASSRGPDAVLIDLDGTLVDTVDVWRGAYLALADELGVRLPDDFWTSIAGRSMQGSLSVLGPAVDHHGPEVLVGRLVAAAAADLRRSGSSSTSGPDPSDTRRVWTWLPGAEALLDLLWVTSPPSSRPATALVTSAWHAFTDPLLEAALADRHGSFGAVVCGDDVARPKPAPEPYLRAAALLGGTPSTCLVIEDSPTGVASAEAAGMVVLAVPHAGPIARAPGRAVRTDLTGLTLDDLAELHAALRSELLD